MFDIGWTELLIIAVVAILIVGPKELPRMLRTFGNYAGKMRSMAGEFRSQFDEAIKEAELDELRSGVESIRNMDPLKGVKDSLAEGFEPLKSTADDIKRSAESAVTAKKPAESNPAAEPEADTKSPAQATAPASAAEPAARPAKKRPAQTRKPAGADSGGA